MSKANNALARAQRQFWNEYTKALADPEGIGLPASFVVYDLYHTAERTHLDQQEKRNDV